MARGFPESEWRARRGASAGSRGWASWLGAPWLGLSLGLSFGLSLGLSLGLGLWLLAAPALAGSPPPSTTPIQSTPPASAQPVLLVVGDSLSAAYGIERQRGWVHLLRQRLEPRAEVVNASISGETSAGGASRLPDLLRQHRPDIVLLALGGNDGLRGLPPRQFEANLAAMITASQAADARVLLLGIDIPPNYGRAYRTAFTAVFPRLAERFAVPLVPFLLDGVALDATLMQDDGLHPNAAAQPRILDTVWPALTPLLERAGVRPAPRTADTGQP